MCTAYFNINNPLLIFATDCVYVYFIINRINSSLPLTQLIIKKPSVALVR
jgi:hypothetical protein